MTEQPYRRAPNGIAYRLAGEGEPLLMLHGLMVSGAMFDPLVPLLSDRFRMIIPDLRGHGLSKSLAGPYEAEDLAADLAAVLADSGVERAAVMGYSHGGAVAQEFARRHPAAVSKLMLVATYACNVGSFRERLEARIAVALLRVLSPATIAKIIFRSRPADPSGPRRLTPEQVTWLRSIMAANDRPAMCGAVHGLVTFDSRGWLDELAIPTLIVAATHDEALPRYHYDTLLHAIPGARGQLIDRAGHALAWTHTRELADVLRAA